MLKNEGKQLSIIKSGDNHIEYYDNLHWNGPRESDINYLSEFKSSSVIFGTNSRVNQAYCDTMGIRINHNEQNINLADYFCRVLNELITCQPDVKIMFYNQYLAYEHGQSVIDHTVCLNDLDFLAFLQEKIKVRSWIAEYCDVIPSVVLPYEQCFYQNLNEILPDAQQGYIAQKSVGSGGIGTHLITEVFPKLPDNAPDSVYLISSYLFPCIPINHHVVIFDDDILTLTGSIQLVSHDSKNQILYRGGDFFAYASLPDAIKEKAAYAARIIGQQLQRNGYRGVAGIDFLIHNDILYFMEINPRFQASTSLLNKTLVEHGYASVQTLNLMAFSGAAAPCIPSDISVPYSNYTYFCDDFQCQYLLDKFTAIPSIITDIDGYNMSHNTPGAYSYRVNFPYNIASITQKNDVNIHDNISVCDTAMLKGLMPSSSLSVKIALLNQGISITETAMKQCADFHQAVFDALDLEIFDGLYVNAPYNTRFSVFSPFQIVTMPELSNPVSASHEQLALSWYGQYLCGINIARNVPVLQKTTKSGISMNNIVTLATDRLRINHTGVCYFKTTGQGCKFCNLPSRAMEYQLEDIYETFDFCLKNISFRHILIGGGSRETEKEISYIISIVQYIKKICDKEIYVMCQPPCDKSSLRSLYDAGVDEIALNIEVFSDEAARKLMPGKGRIQRKFYIESLKECVKLWGQTGKVKSLLIAGLEKNDVLFSGVESLCALGVQPVISVFRPLKNTHMETMLPPSTKELLFLYDELNKICDKYGQTLGPSCSMCQNNTLSYPWCHEISVSKLCL